MKSMYSFNDIMRFLDQEMSTEEKDAFQKELLENDALQKQVRECEVLIAGLRDNDLKETREIVRRFETNQKAKPFPYLKVAAAIVILLLAGLFLYQWKPTGYGSYFEPYPNVVQTRGIPAGALDATMQAYTQGDYETAIAGLVRLEKSDTISFYLGNAYLFSDKPELAEEYLGRVLGSTSQFSHQAEWLMVRALLDQNKKQEAARVIDTILNNPAHTYHDLAARLRNEAF